jgi:glycosyltransferase involved in cell wall biosynthesis
MRSRHPRECERQNLYPEDIRLKPKVTIGMCVRNSADTVGEAIESVVTQCFAKASMELIFVDDGSEDDTLELIKRYIPKLDVQTEVFSHSWHGIGYSRNIVVSNAKGDYIVWVDGDMILSHDFLAKLVDFMDRHPNAGIAKGIQALDRGGNLLATLEAYSRAASRMVDFNTGEARSKTLGTGGSIYRLLAIRNANGFDHSLRGYGEDWDAEAKIKRLGWSLHVVDVAFRDYERFRMTWKDLWARYWRRGYFSHYFLHKNPGLIKLYKMTPAGGLLAGISSSHKLFRITRQRFVYLLPFQYMFKMAAWSTGFLESHINSYQPKC